MKLILHVFVMLFLCQCTHEPQTVVDVTYAPKTATGKQGAVASAHPLASEIGIAILRKGGHAVDAAIAVSFAISVLRPQSTGIGGGGFLLLHEPEHKDVLVYDFRERAPERASVDMYVDAKGESKSFQFEGQDAGQASINGHLAVGVPGIVAGMAKLYKDHGRLPWKDLLEPAIQLAEEGFLVYPGLARAMANTEKRMALFPATKAIFMPEGRPMAVGERLVQKDLARTLRFIAEKGMDGFYSGPVGEAIVQEMQRGRGIVTSQDLLHYEVKMRRPVVGTYRGYKVVSMPPPSSGGVHVVQMLNVLESFPVKDMGYGSVAYSHLFTETMRRAFMDRAQHLGDPAFVDVPTQHLISKSYATKMRDTINLEQASTSQQLKNPSLAILESNETTHISIVDAEGHAVATTQTINHHFGSCVVAEGTGVVLNNEMDDFTKQPGSSNGFGLVEFEKNIISPGKTMLSSMSPTMVFSPDGPLQWVLGSPGGPRIITAVTQTLVNLIDFGMEPLQAVAAKRLHHQWMPDELLLEPGALQPDVLSDLKDKGHDVKENTTGYTDVELISRMPDGRWVGVSDVRSDGEPRAF